MSRLYKNWTVHNLIAHPLSEIVWLLSLGMAKKTSGWIHDVTLPENPEDNGRG